MRRGTTPTHTFHTDCDCSAMQEIYITYQQSKTGDPKKMDTVLEIDNSEGRITATPETLEVELTQEETLNFDADKRVYVQIRVATAAGKALASNVMQASVHDILKDGVI